MDWGDSGSVGSGVGCEWARLGVSRRVRTGVAAWGAVKHRDELIALIKATLHEIANDDDSDDSED